jgi:hypothetical protein
MNCTNTLLWSNFLKTLLKRKALLIFCKIFFFLVICYNLYCFKNVLASCLLYFLILCAELYVLMLENNYTLSYFYKCVHIISFFNHNAQKDINNKKLWSNFLKTLLKRKALLIFCKIFFFLVICYNLYLIDFSDVVPVPFCE